MFCRALQDPCTSFVDDTTALKISAKASDTVDTVRHTSDGFVLWVNILLLVFSWEKCAWQELEQAKTATSCLRGNVNLFGGLLN